MHKKEGIMVIKGNVVSIIFQNKDNGYTVAKIESNGEKITLVGKIPSLFEGQTILAQGHFITNSKWGEQFNVESFEIEQPNSREAIEKYLSSGLIAGVGPATAKKIVDKFGTDTLDVIEFNPLKLTSISGVSAKKAAEINSAFLNLRRMQDVVMFLQEYNISVNMAVKIFNIYGDDTKNILQTNPYKLVEDIRGVGFKSADKIAVSLGIQKDSTFRIRAGLVYALNETSEKSGNTYLPKEELIQNLSKLLDLNFDDYQEQLSQVLKELTFEGLIKEMKVEDVDCVMLLHYYLLEQHIANKLLMMSANLLPMLDLEDEIQHFQQINNVELHQDQKNAVINAINNGVSVITGGPGTGKTTIIKCILNILKNHKQVVTLLAPTGRAAKRMSESCEADASTIHRALMLDFGHGRMETNHERFIYNERNPLPSDVVIVDEVSMVDVQLMYNLVSALKPTTRLILVGDKNQLPSVGAGNVLADIISSGSIPVSSLTKIYRQADKSLIIYNAHAINNGEMPKIDNTSHDFFFEKCSNSDEILRRILDMQSVRIPRFLNIEPQKIQVLAPLKAGVCGVDNINNQIQKIINPKKPNQPEVILGDVIFRKGDKVMQTQNNYNLEWKRFDGGRVEYGEAVFNGDIGFISDVTEAGAVEVTFEDGRIATYLKTDLGQLSLSYAITIHKSQGSEFDVVIMPVIGGASSILTRNLLYTGVTRAKKMVVLVGQYFHLKLMVNNDYTATRYSALKLFLIQQNEKAEKLLNEQN